MSSGGRPGCGTGEQLASRSLPDMGPIRLGREQILEHARIRDLELHHPAATVGIPIDDAGVVIQRGIHFNDLPGNRTVELRYSLDRFDLAEALMGLEPVAWFGKSDEDDVAQFTLGIVGN